MKKYILFSLLLLFSVSAKTQTVCTEADLSFKKEKLLWFRLQALQGQDKLPEYNRLGIAIAGNFSTLYAQYSHNKKEGKPYLDQMCRIVDQMIALSDDLLAGGNGLGKSTPWEKQTPEALFKIIEEFKTYSKPEDAAHTEEIRIINEKLAEIGNDLADGDDPVEVINENYEPIFAFISKQKAQALERQKSENPAEEPKEIAAAEKPAKEIAETEKPEKTEETDKKTKETAKEEEK